MRKYEKYYNFKKIFVLFIDVILKKFMYLCIIFLKSVFFVVIFEVVEVIEDFCCVVMCFCFVFYNFCGVIFCRECCLCFLVSNCCLVVVNGVC